jgi:hypothetical protein
MKVLFNTLKFFIKVVLFVGKLILKLASITFLLAVLMTGN